MEFINLGLVKYSKVHKKQKQFLDQIIYDKAKEKIIFCSHFSVVTCGRRNIESDLTSWKGEVVKIERGGRATYHGPSQMMIYPLINLAKNKKYIKAYSVQSFLEALENTVVLVLQKYYKIDALNSRNLPTDVAKNFLKKAETNNSKGSVTGVWVGNKKIASIGIAVKKWVTYHGVAINIDKDAQAFLGINPCGFERSVMTSIEECLGCAVDRKKLESHFKEACTKIFS